MVKQFFQSIRLYLHRKDKFYGLSVSQLGFIPCDEKLYRLALLHRSASNKKVNGLAPNYERLEFLGDAVLGAVAAEWLYKTFPDREEGFLTCVRAQMVNRGSLNDVAIWLGLDKSVVAGTDISRNKHVYGDVFEAFIGAMFLDQGFACTQRFIENVIFKDFFDKKKLAAIDKNYKSRLIEWGQKTRVEPHFNTEAENGKKNRFCCIISIEENEMGKGFGGTKKEAEQCAASNAIRKLQKEAQGNLDI